MISFYPLPYGMWIVAFNAILKLGIMCFDIDLDDYIGGSGSVEFMALSTELPAGHFIDVARA